MIRVVSDKGGGHKAHAYKGQELRFTSKRHADPVNAVGSAKQWIDDNAPVTESKHWPASGIRGDMSHLFKERPNSGRDAVAANRKVWVERKGQSQLQNPDDTTIVSADYELEVLRQQAANIQKKVADVTAKAQAFVDALANKEGGQEGGMMGLQMEAARLQTELNQKLLELPQNFIRFADGVTMAKKQNARLADPAWGSMVEAVQTRGRGVMKRVAQVLDRLSILFQKLTANVTIQEFGPGELDEKKMKKLVTKNKENTDKITKYVDDQKAVAPSAQKYLLDSAQGRVQLPYSK